MKMSLLVALAIAAAVSARDAGAQVVPSVGASAARWQSEGGVAWGPIGTAAVTVNGALFMPRLEVAYGRFQTECSAPTCGVDEGDLSVLALEAGFEVSPVIQNRVLLSAGIASIHTKYKQGGAVDLGFSAGVSLRINRHVAPQLKYRLRPGRESSGMVSFGFITWL